jgi:beta-glucosidase/6-phospho-beta-glucosidase/beta-galactosidase
LVNDLRIKDNSSHHQHSHGILNDLGWEIYPQGLYNLIIHILNQWGKDIPIFITENGVADKSDKYRAPFIVSHLRQIRQAIDDGANVIGYLHWSLMDNYEWFDHYRPEAKFGLFHVNIDDDNDNFNLRRKITKGAQAYKLIIKESFNQSKDGAVTDSAISNTEHRFGSFSPDGFNISIPK